MLVFFGLRRIAMRWGRLNVTFALAIGMLAWGSNAFPEEVLRPPLGDEWMTLETPRPVSPRALGSETVVLGDVWFEPRRSVSPRPPSVLHRNRPRE